MNLVNSLKRIRLANSLSQFASNSLNWLNKSGIGQLCHDCEVVCGHQHVCHPQQVHHQRLGHVERLEVHFNSMNSVNSLKQIRLANSLSEFASNSLIWLNKSGIGQLCHDYEVVRGHQHVCRPQQVHHQHLGHVEGVEVHFNSMNSVNSLKQIRLANSLSEFA